MGHKIPAGGIAITGQEQTQYGGGFQEGAGAPKGNNIYMILHLNPKTRINLEGQCFKSAGLQIFDGSVFHK